MDKLIETDIEIIKSCLLAIEINYNIKPMIELLEETQAIREVLLRIDKSIVGKEK